LAVNVVGESKCANVKWSKPIQMVVLAVQHCLNVETVAQHLALSSVTFQSGLNGQTVQLPVGQAQLVESEASKRLLSMEGCLAGISPNSRTATSPPVQLIVHNPIGVSGILVLSCVEEALRAGTEL
jgi:hypothetical protein